ncbi:MAG: hypothetical protein NVS4B11_30200 [Ktedonobacteraceae bacterium]
MSLSDLSFIIRARPVENSLGIALPSTKSVRLLKSIHNGASIAYILAKGIGTMTNEASPL